MLWWANMTLYSQGNQLQPAERDAWRQKQLMQGYVDNSRKLQQGSWQVYIQNGARVMRHDGSMA